MKPFQQKPSCPKCGGKDVYTKFYAGQVIWGDPNIPERLERRCRECNYPWNEHPKDAKRKGNRLR